MLELRGHRGLLVHSQYGAILVVNHADLGQAIVRPGDGISRLIIVLTLTVGVKVMLWEMKLNVT